MYFKTPDSSNFSHRGTLFAVIFTNLVAVLMCFKWDSGQVSSALNLTKAGWFAFLSFGAF